MRFMRLLCRLKSGDAVRIAPPLAVCTPAKKTDCTRFNRNENGYILRMKEGYKMTQERYVIGKDFNTKDWFIFDNETGQNVCWCETEEEEKEHVKKLRK